MSLILLRVAVSAVILTAPFLFLAVSTGKVQGAIWLMIPFALFIPVLLISIFLLTPVEALAEKAGLDANIVVPVFGGFIGALVVAVTMKYSKDPEIISKFVHGDSTTVVAACGVVLAGAVVAGSWRLSLWVLKYLQWA